MATDPNPGVALVWAAKAGDWARLRDLLAEGAPVNVAVPFDPPFHESAGTALYWAAGFHANRDATALLLDAGASPNDNETLYHVMEHGDPALLRLVARRSKHALDRGQWSYALIHLMDFEAPAMLEEYLDASTAAPASFDPHHRHPQTGETALHWAIKRGRSVGILSRLLAAGFDPGAIAHDGRTCRDYAACLGDRAALTAMGDGPLSRVAGYLLACTTGDRARVEALTAADPSIRADSAVATTHALLDTAWAGRLEAVRGLIELAGLAASAATPSGATALHHAAFQGDLALTRYLLMLGHPTDLTDRAHHATPLGWATWASMQKDRPAPPRGDYPGVVRALLEAGAPKPASVSGSGPVRAVLGEFGVGT